MRKESLLRTITMMSGTAIVLIATYSTLARANDNSEVPQYREMVLKTVQSNFEKLRECFKEATDRKESNIPSKLSTIFKIGRYGNVQSVVFEEASEMSDELNKCIVGRISYFQFPSRSEEQPPISNQSVVRLILNFAKE